MEKLIHHLNERFPFLKGLEVMRDDEPESLPTFLGILLSAMEASDPGACCFVFPRKEEIGRLVSVLFALIKLREKFPILLSEFVSKLTPGDFVKIPPSPKIFGFLGDDPEKSGRMLLKCKPTGLSTFAQKSVPKAFANRLVRAHSSVIRGRLEDCSLKDNPTPLDSLLGIQSHGNLGMIPNFVLVLDAQGRFETFATDSILRRRGSASSTSIEDLKVCGYVSPAGPRDGQIVEISPGHLVGVTSSIELLIDACASSALQKKAILINDVSLLKSPQYFDTLSEDYNVIIIAEHSELEKINELRQRNCKIWSFTEREIRLGQSSIESPRASTGFFKHVFNATENLNLAPKAIPCESPILEAISIELELLNDAVKGEGRDELRNLIGKLYGMLTSASGVLFTPTISEFIELREKIGNIRGELERQKHWLSTDCYAHLSKACTLYEEVFAPSSQLGTGKREKLKEVLKKLKSEGKVKIGILTKREQQFDGIRAIAKLAETDVAVFTGQAALLPDDYFDAVVCVNWPGSDAFKRFFRRYMAPDIRLLVYPFESRWLTQCRKRIKSESAGVNISNSERSKLLNLNPMMDFNWPKPSAEIEAAEEVEGDGFSITNFERTLSETKRGSGILSADTSETVDATYVEFSGGAFAFLTEAHALPVATQLVLNPGAGQQRLPERDVSDWKTGDYIVFLTSGETEVLHEIANRIMGDKAILLRKTARIWKDALAASGLNPTELHRSLADVDCRRTLATVRNWLTKHSQIGPEEKSDLEAIAEVTKFKPLIANVEQVWNAIGQIWAYHISAGTVLRRILALKLPGVIHELEESGTEITIEDGGRFLGSAKIVKVESIGQNAEKCSPSLVNHLRFEQETENI